MWILWSLLTGGRRYGGDSGIVIAGRWGPAVAWAAVFLLVFLLAALAAQVLFGVAAYHDARSLADPNAPMWGLLIGFLGLLPGVIYLCLRAVPRRPVCCTKCGCWHSALDPACPKCGEPNPQAAFRDTGVSRALAEKAKKELIAGAVCAGASVVFLAVFAAGVVLLSMAVF